MHFESLLNDVSAYYSQKLRAHGATPKGVDWNGEASQTRRFEQLLKAHDGSGPFSIIEFGCGYGALVQYLHAHYRDVSYTGFDISEDMISAAKSLFGTQPSCRFVARREDVGDADLAVASGIFNVKLSHDSKSWEAYIATVLDDLARTGRGTFSFNMLTSYSDPDKKRPDLYYGDPCFYFDYCKRNYSRNVALLHDYDLYEFTLIVRRTP